MLGKSSQTYLVLLPYGRSSTGPHLVRVKSISLYIRRAYVPRSALGLHSSKCPMGRSCFNYWHAFLHGTDRVRSRCCSESAGELAGLCLQQVWFGWEKHPAGRCKPEHIGKLMPNGTLVACRTQVKTHGWAG